MISASAPAKVIMTGEHFVVHGQPALAAAVTLYSRATVELGPPNTIEISSATLKAKSIFLTKPLETKSVSTRSTSVLEPLKLVAERALERSGQRDLGLKIHLVSQIPVGVGLGSSASTAVSTAAAVAKFLNLGLDKSAICELASVQERFIHKTPSGIDATTSTYGGVILFKMGEPPVTLPLRGQISLVIGNTRVERSTGELVTKVTRRVEVGDSDLIRTSSLVGKLTLEAVKAYEKEDFQQVGQLMNANHELLMRIGVSTPYLDRLVEIARKAGALGAKLTGAGGGGCMMALSRHEDVEKVEKAIAEAGGKTYVVSVDLLGVKSDTEQPERVPK